MSTHDYNIANDTFPNVRSDINSALAAILSINSNATAPTTTAAGMLWYDTANALVKQRNAADSGWNTLWAVVSTPTFGNIELNSNTIQSTTTNPLQFGKEVAFPSSATTLTISSGSVTASTSMHLIANESAASTDDLDTITAPPGSERQWLFLKSADTSKSTVFRDSSVSGGNIQTPHALPVTMSGGEIMVLMYDSSSKWVLYSYPAASAPYQRIDRVNYANLAGKNHYDGDPITWQSASTVRIPSGYCAVDATGVANIIAASNLDVALSSSGALGLDTGSEASNTWYYLWLCKGSSGVTAIFSASASSPTVPTGYTDYKRRLPVAVRNNASSNIMPFVCDRFQRWVYYSPLDYDQNQGGTPAGDTLILSNGNSTTAFSGSPAAVSAASFVPPQAKLFLAHTNVNGALGRAFIRPTGSTVTTGREIGYASAASATQGRNDMECVIHTNSSQSFDYRVTASGTQFTVAVMAYPFI